MDFSDFKRRRFDYDAIMKKPDSSLTSPEKIPIKLGPFRANRKTDSGLLQT